MFGRATIRLGIGPHSSYVCSSICSASRPVGLSGTDCLLAGYLPYNRVNTLQLLTFSNVFAVRRDALHP